MRPSPPALLIPFLFSGCDPAASPGPGPGGAPLSFSDAAERAGLKVKLICGGKKEKDWIIEANGSGCSLLDYDLDGDLDVFLVNGAPIESLTAGTGSSGTGAPAPSDALFRNEGGLRFTDVTRALGLLESDWGCGSAAADYDNDGDPDLYVTNYGPDRLYRNQGDGTFADVTREAGVGDPAWGASCVWLDYDRDGHLDLLVVNYLEFDIRRVKRRGADPSCRLKGQPIMCGPVGLPPAYCTLYRNLGDGRFEDRSAASGIRSAGPSYGLGAIALDYNRDDLPDLYVTNDTRPNLLFENRGDGTFIEVGLRAGAALNDMAVAQAGMGVDATFRGGNGFEDLFVVNFEDDNNTYRRNEGNGFFTEITAALGLAAPCFKHLGWSCFFFDADLDGDEDLFVGQGHVVPEADLIPSSPGYRQPNKLFLDDGSGKFIDASGTAGPGFSIKKSHRGAAFGDLDGDGDADIVASAIDDLPSLLLNDGPPRGRWLAVRTRGTVSNRDGIGAVVSLSAGGKAGKVQRRRIRSGSSFASSCEIAARFGLGSLARVDELRVRWPTGKEETYPVPGVDRALTVEEGKGRPAAAP